MVALEAYYAYRDAGDQPRETHRAALENALANQVSKALRALFGARFDLACSYRSCTSDSNKLAII